MNTEVALANADGGVIVVGLHDGQVEGTDSNPRHRNALIQAAVDYAVPPVRVRSALTHCHRTGGEPDHLLVLEIDPSEHVHANHRDEVFLRVGDEARKLTFQQRQELLYDKGQANFETTRIRDAGLDVLDLALLRRYADDVGHPDPLGLLKARGLVRDDDLTVGGCLLFAKNPQAWFPQALVRVLRYRGSQRGSGARQQLVSDVRLEGPIPQVLEQAHAAIARLQPTRRALTAKGRFDDVPLVPRDVWLEGVVNAVVHRSYSLSGDHIRVEVFDDRIEIESPGRFPGVVDLNDPLHATRFARNPRIARVCADLRFGQEFGEGIRRMFEEMRLAGLTDPLYRQTSGSVRLTLSGEPVDRELDARLPAEARLIVSALREAGRLSTGEVAELVGLGRPATIRRLYELQDAGMIRWVGKSARDPRAYWETAT